MKRLGIALATAGGVALLVSAPAGATTSRGVSVNETPKQIFAAAETATLAATDVTIDARETIAGTATTIVVSGRYPTYLKASVTAGGQNQGMVVHGSTTYFEASAGVWQAAFKLTATEAQPLAGHWYSAATSDPLIAAAASDNDPKVIERSVFASLATIASVHSAKARKVIVGGRRALVVGDKYGEVYIAATGRPFLLRITSNTKTVKGFVEFNDFDAPLPVALPTASGELDSSYAAALSNGASTTTTVAS